MESGSDFDETRISTCEETELKKFASLTALTVRARKEFKNSSGRPDTHNLSGTLKPWRYFDFRWINCRNRFNAPHQMASKAKIKMNHHAIRRPSVWQLVLVISGCAAFSFGIWGSYLHLKEAGKSATVLDGAYRAIQLFSFDLYESGTYPWQLEIARWLAPFVAVSAIISAFSNTLFGVWLDFKLSWMKSHTVVIGNDWFEVTPQASPSSLVFAQISSKNILTQLKGGHIHASASTYKGLIEKCAMYRSQTIIIKTATGSDAFTWIAELSYANQQLHRKPLEVSFLLNSSDDPASITELGRLAEPNLQIRVLRQSDLVLSVCLDWLARTIAAQPSNRTAVHLRLAGDAAHCAELFRKLALLLVPVPGLMIQVDILNLASDEASSIVCNQVIAQAPDLRCDIQNFNIQSLTSGSYSATDLLCFCTPDTTDFLQHLGPLVSLSAAHPDLRLAILIPEFEEDLSSIQSLLDRHQKPYLSFLKVGSESNMLAMIKPDSATEKLALEIHASYLKTIKNPDAPAGKTWADLPARYRDSTRIQVQSVEFKLACLGFTTADAIANPKRLRESVECQMEALAEAEHKRWITEKRLLGWTYAEQRNEVSKKHPCMVPYAQLAEQDKEKDRVMWREILRHVEGGGLALF